MRDVPGNAGMVPFGRSSDKSLHRQEITSVADSDFRGTRATLTQVCAPPERACLGLPAAVTSVMPCDASGPTSAALETLFQTAPVGMAFIDRAFRYVRVNETLARYNGLAAEAHVGRTVADVVPHFWPSLKPLYERALAGGVVTGQEISGQRADTPFQVIHRRISCSPVRVGHEIVGFGAIVLDTLRERRAETQASRLAAIVESSDDAIVATDLDGIVTSWNKGAQRIFGYAAEDMVGSPVTRLIPAARQDEEQGILQAIRRGDGIEPFETVWRAKDGRLIHVSVAVSPIRDAGGHVVGASKTARDITERRRTTEALAQSERQLRALAGELTIERAHLVAAQAVARMGSYATDLRTRAVTWSAETYHIFEADLATVAPSYEQFLARVHPDDRDPVDRAFVASFDSRGISALDYRIQTPDGRVKHVNSRWRVTHADDGTPVRAVGTLHDITERKEAEERVRSADARLRAVLNNAPVVIFAADTDGRYTLLEGRGLLGIGLAPGELLGRSIGSTYANLELIPSDGLPVPLAVAFRRVLAGESTSGLIKVGTEYFESHMVPDRDADGRVVGAIGVSTVVTALRESEAMLRRSMADLQAISTRLNDAREQERVKMARDIHDNFGQALTALKMDVAEIRRRLDAGDGAIIRERLAEMSALIDTSVDDVRRVAAELRPVVLDDLGFVGAIRAYLIDVERRAAIRCVLCTPSGDVPIAGDRATALFRILQEALTNVVRHAGATRVDVSLTVDAGRVRLVVRDNGRGVPAAAVTSPRSLGLLGMRDRAVLIGGDVSVSGGPGAGTTVTVELPIEGPST
jgi:PAS domain S-box-containing protein